MVWKAQGVSDEDLRRPDDAQSARTCIGLVKHLGSVEYGWFCETFGRESDAGRRSTTPTRTRTCAPSRASRRRTSSRTTRGPGRPANAVIAELDLEATGTAWYGATVTLRWVLIHMLEDTARHAGHMDIVRELIDGATGDHDRSDQD